jgi:hypothetical protein
MYNPFGTEKLTSLEFFSGFAGGYTNILAITAQFAIQKTEI